MYKCNRCGHRETYQSKLYSYCKDNCKSSTDDALGVIISAVASTALDSMFDTISSSDYSSSDYTSSSSDSFSGSGGDFGGGGSSDSW